MQKKKIGLALGGGSARGWAHFGVIQALEEAKIPINYIAGTSIGAYIGAIHAAGRLTDFRKNFAEKIDRRSIYDKIDLTLGRGGFIDGKRLEQLLKTYTDGKSFKELNLPFAAVATSLLNGKEVVIKSGDLIQAVRASISLPVIFTPVQHGNDWLMDGGLVNPVPISVVKAMGADIVIAVDLNSDLVGRRFCSWNTKKKVEENKVIENFKTKLSAWFEPKEKFPNLFETLGSSVDITQKQITEKNLEICPPDILIQPRLSNLRLFDFNKAKTSIAEGYQCTKKLLPKIKLLVES